MPEQETRKTAWTQVCAEKKESQGIDPGYKIRECVSIVIFGASGDLSRRKLIPALLQLGKGGYLPDHYFVLGLSRSPMTDEAYRRSVGDHLTDSGLLSPEEDASGRKLLQSLYYLSMDVNDADGYRKLKVRLEELEASHELCGNRLFYLAVGPEYFTPIVRQLAAAGLIHGERQSCWSRVIIEKPFGRDLESARALNAEVKSVLEENQVYRIDHYLGKETVQNILGFRFGNSIFEPLFNQKYVDHIQISVAETLGMEGRRGAYFDQAGMLRDMVQNHMLQLLCLIAMEPPASTDAQSIRDEKVKLLRALVPMGTSEVARNTVRGQYGPGSRSGQPVKAYRLEEGVPGDSVTESYVALRLHIDNWRWAGIPFLLRAGKRLRSRVTEIAVQFRQPPMHLFRQVPSDEGAPLAVPHSNVLVLRIQPDEGIRLLFACKRPGMRFRLDEVEMDFLYQSGFSQRAPEAYERLLLDAMRGDASLFTRSDEVEYAWRFISSIHHGWASLPPPEFPNYEPFSDGPGEAAHLASGTVGGWRCLPAASAAREPALQA